MKAQYLQITNILVALLISLASCQLERDPSIVVKEQIIKDPNYLPESLREKFAEYTSLEDLEGPCNLVYIVENSSDIESIKSRILEKDCIPDVQTLNLILENGQIELVEFLIKDLYLKREVDPSGTINSYIGKTDKYLRKMDLLFSDLSDYKPTSLKYSFMNFDNFVRLIAKLPKEVPYQPESLTIYCYRNSFYVSGFFIYKKDKIQVKEKKYLFDEVESDCEYTYNSFAMELEITLKKKNRMKKWESLFK